MTIEERIAALWSTLPQLQLDRANSVIRRCADNYDTLKAGLEAGH